jgi:hypothetical protein
MSETELRGKPGMQGKIVTKSDVSKQTTTEPAHDGPCCGHCEEAAQKARERVQGDKAPTARKKSTRKPSEG